MGKIATALMSLLLLTACSKDYPYADRMLEFYEDTVDEYDDAESIEELQQLRDQARDQVDQIQKEFKANHEEMIHDMELFEEDAYLIHLQLLSAESYAGWKYMKRMHELKEETE